MNITQLIHTIDEISEHLRVVTDLRKRAYESRGAYADLAEIGLDTSAIFKSALILEEQLTYQLSVANQTYKLMKQVDDSESKANDMTDRPSPDHYKDDDIRQSGSNIFDKG